jgi:hypothetical protein
MRSPKGNVMVIDLRVPMPFFNWHCRASVRLSGGAEWQLALRRHGVPILVDGNLQKFSNRSRIFFIFQWSELFF